MIDVWIPPDTAERYRALLPAGIELHTVPRENPPERLGRGEFLVADDDLPRVIATMQRLDGLRVLQSMAAGVDRLLPHVPPGVILCDAAGVHDVPVSEWTIMAILAMRRRLPVQVRWQETQRWHPEHLDADDLEGSTVLILGYGSIGRALEARLQPFGVELVRVARSARDGVHALAELPSLLPRADVVVLLLPLTSETRGVIDQRMLSLMKPGALLVNAARGALVDSAALTDAVLGGRIQAALDVTDPEPLPDAHPLWSAPGVLITPHTAGSVRRVYERAWQLVADQLGRYLRGEPLRNVVRSGY